MRKLPPPGLDVGAKLTDAAFPPEVLNMDWSGKRFWYLYNMVAKNKFEVFAKDATHADTYSQWLSLAVTGMWGEDKAILKFMIDKEFKNRNQYGEAFKGRKASGAVAEVKLIPVKHVTKLASAAQTDLGAQDAAIDIRHAVVSGRAVSTWNDDDKRAALLSTRDVVEVSMLCYCNCWENCTTFRSLFIKIRLILMLGTKTKDLLLNDQANQDPLEENRRN